MFGLSSLPATPEEVGYISQPTFTKYKPHPKISNPV
jgi:hypothetical protein